MDILAHGLWAGAVAKTLQRLGGKRVNFRATVAWGIAPDLVAFSGLFSFLLLGLVQGELSAARIATPEFMSQPPWNGHPIFRITTVLYNLTHSAVLFLAVFGVICGLLRRPCWEMGGWLLHILLDIPTHSRSFYPTPFLWPVSDLTADGVSWTEPWMVAANYGAIASIWGWLHISRRRPRLADTDEARTRR
jgi:hypothetical protein